MTLADIELPKLMQDQVRDNPPCVQPFGSAAILPV